jgi:hypothetical protein
MLWLASLQLAWAKPAEIILLRHGEKPPEDWNVHLSPRGRERAQALANLLTTDPAFTSNGLPAALFAARPTPHGHGERASETLQPLATKLKLPIQMPYASADSAQLAKLLLDDPTLDGKTVVVCWVHEHLPDLAEALGVKRVPAHWKSTEFDRLWVIRFHGKKSVLKDFPQRLLPGDSSR